jgi:hypothetical protein
MAAQVQLDLRIDIRLEALRAMLADLPAVIQEWPELTDAERASWSLDWDQMVGAIAVVIDPAYRSGRMRGEQRKCYRAVLARLRAVLPELRALHLAVPRIALDS